MNLTNRLKIMQKTRLRTPQKPESKPRPVPEMKHKGKGMPMPTPNSPGFQRSFMPGTELLESQLISNRRRAILSDIMDMAKNDPRISRMLYKLASDATHKHYTVEIEEAPTKRAARQALEVIKRTDYMLNLKTKIRGWTECLLRDGDLFLQLMIDGHNMEIAEAKKLATEITHSRMNAQGQFPDDKKPYYQSTIYDTSIEVKGFEEWEIVHIKWREEDGQPYGEPLFQSARLAQKRTQSGEQDVAMRRKVMAAMRYIFNIGTEENPATWEEVEKFKEENADSLDNPLNPIAHFFLNGLGTIEAIRGDPNIGEMADIEHHEGLLHTVGLTNSGLMSGGREKGTNYAVIDHQEEDYLRSLVNIDDTIEYQGIRPIYNRNLTLAGINPDSINYTLNWGSKDRDALDKKILRGALLIEMGYSHKTAYSIIDLDNDITYEEELERIMKQIEDGTIPYKGPTVSGRTQTPGPTNSPKLDQTQMEK